MELGALLFTHWSWFILALASAALATGMLTLVLGLGWELQLVAFAVLAIASVLWGRNYLRRNPPHSTNETLNRRGERMVGEVVTVIEAIEGGEGRVQVGDSPWLAPGPDMPAGSRARNRSVDGSRRIAEPAYT